MLLHCVRIDMNIWTNELKISVIVEIVPNARGWWNYPEKLQKHDMNTFKNMRKIKTYHGEMQKDERNIWKIKETLCNMKEICEISQEHAKTYEDIRGSYWTKSGRMLLNKRNRPHTIGTVEGTHGKISGKWCSMKDIGEIWLLLSFHFARMLLNSR